MAAVPTLQRHAYEVVRTVPCYAHFDLERTPYRQPVYELEQPDEQAAEVARLEVPYFEESRVMLSWAPLFVSTSVFARLGTRRQVQPASCAYVAYNSAGR